jgi:hypothetical protein
MFLFGAGVMCATPLIDAYGNTISNPTPAPFGVSQDVSLDFDFEAKPLYGANQFPVAVGRGKGKVSGKVKQAKIYASLFNTMFFGQPTNQTAGFFSIYNDTVGALIPTTPFQITPSVPSSGTWDSDLGVAFGVLDTQVPMTRVASSPATGQYSVSAGVYTFAAADVGVRVFINYRYTATVTGAQKVTVANLLMGYAPTVQLDLSVSYAGKVFTIRLPNALPSKWTWAFKNDDWTIPDYDFECFTDSLGNIAYYSMTT